MTNQSKKTKEELRYIAMKQFLMGMAIVYGAIRVFQMGYEYGSSF